MKRYRTLDYIQVQKYLKENKLHLSLHNTKSYKIHDLVKLNQQLQSQNGKINSFLTNYFEHNLKVLPHLLSLPTTYAKALLIGIYSYVPELRKKNHVNGYCSSTEHYYFVFHNANLHTKTYWKQLTDDIRNATQIPIYYETFFTHNLKPYLQNFRDMCYSTRAITKLCFINTIKLSNKKHKLIYDINNIPISLKTNNKELIHSKRIATNKNKTIALYKLKNKNVLIDSKDLIKRTH